MNSGVSNHPSININLQQLIKNCNLQTIPEKNSQSTDQMIKVSTISQNSNFNADLIQALKISLDAKENLAKKISKNLLKDISQNISEKIKKNIKIVFNLLNSAFFKFSALASWLAAILALLFLIDTYFLINCFRKRIYISQQIWWQSYALFKYINLSFLTQKRPVQYWFKWASTYP